MLASYDPSQSVDLLTDPGSGSFIAVQMNDGTLNQNVAGGAPRVKDLTEAITDVIVRDVAQGAGTLEVHIVDPWWMLFERFGAAPAFIDVDDSGLLIPVDVNFPDGTDCWWRLAACTNSIDTTQANLTLTFEDRIVAQMRDLGGPLVAARNETRAAFIYRTVRQIPGLRFVCPALSQAPGKVGGDLTQGQITRLGNPTAPKSSTQPSAPSARRNPNKNPGISPKPSHGAYWTPGGWRYTKPIDGLTPRELSILNPPTNVKDS